MKQIDKSLQEYIKSNEYFDDAKKWYYHKYVYPLTQRSTLLIICIVCCGILFSICLAVYGLLPTIVQVKYALIANDSLNKSAKIIRANDIKEKPLESIADILIKNYVIKREQYNYEQLKKQFTFIKNTSSRTAFREFYNFMNIDNISSPIMLYQKNIIRNILILEIKYEPNNTNLAAIFRSLAKNDSGQILEDKIWEAVINYEIDNIDPNLLPGSNFNFKVIQYKLRLIKDNKTNTI